jgi:hypothetical protein
VVAPVGGTTQDVEELAAGDGLELGPEGLVDGAGLGGFVGPPPAVESAGTAVVGGIGGTGDVGDGGAGDGGAGGGRRAGVSAGHQAEQDFGPGADVVNDVPFEARDAVEAAPDVAVDLHHADVVGSRFEEADAAVDADELTPTAFLPGGAFDEVEVGAPVLPLEALVVAFALGDEGEEAQHGAAVNGGIMLICDDQFEGSSEAEDLGGEGVGCGFGGVGLGRREQSEPRARRAGPVRYAHGDEGGVAAEIGRGAGRGGRERKRRQRERGAGERRRSADGWRKRGASWRRC